jgi:hypothetical protein
MIKFAPGMSSQRVFFLSILTKYQVSGRGLALAGAGIEQDAAYWEWHIHQVPEGANIMFGVATKKDRSFYNDLDNQSDGAYNRVVTSQ